jgi:hypothetical protein
MERVLQKYPDRIPVILNPVNIQLDKCKFLILRESTFGHFVSYIIEHHLPKSSCKKGYYFFTKNNTLIPISKLMNTIHGEYCDDDKVLRITIREENTFGFQTSTKCLLRSGFFTLIAKYFRIEDNLE